jgi:protein-tyrosine-phosphatase
MENEHKEPIQFEFPKHRKKVVLLTEYVGTAYDILDPIGKPIAEFFDLARDLDPLLTQLMRKLTN